MKTSELLKLSAWPVAMVLLALVFSGCPPAAGDCAEKYKDKPYPKEISIAPLVRPQSNGFMLEIKGSDACQDAEIGADSSCVCSCFLSNISFEQDPLPGYQLEGRTGTLVHGNDSRTFKVDSDGISLTEDTTDDKGIDISNGAILTIVFHPQEGDPLDFSDMTQAKMSGGGLCIIVDYDGGDGGKH